MSTTIEKIQRQIAENPILLYMKGSPKLPSCGFSAQAVQALSACGERFAYVDILQNPETRFIALSKRLSVLSPAP